MKTCDDLGLEPVERVVTADDLDRADEVLVTNSLRLVAPVRAIGRKVRVTAGARAEALIAHMARRVRAGSVCINDLIVPTADPRLPFGGRGRSGFGVTRGAEGLLEMTVPKVVSTRIGRFRPHLAASTSADIARYAAMTTLLHGDWRARWTALRSVAGPTKTPAP